jgi:hypothetical protein
VVPIIKFLAWDVLSSGRVGQIEWFCGITPLKAQLAHCADLGENTRFSLTKTNVV